MARLVDAEVDQPALGGDHCCLKITPLFEQSADRIVASHVFVAAVVKQRGHISMVLRRIPNEFLTFEQLRRAEDRVDFLEFARYVELRRRLSREARIVRGDRAARGIDRNARGAVCGLRDGTPGPG